MLNEWRRASAGGGWRSRGVVRTIGQDRSVLPGCEGWKNGQDQKYRKFQERRHVSRDYGDSDARGVDARWAEGSTQRRRRRCGRGTAGNDDGGGELDLRMRGWEDASWRAAGDAAWREAGPRGDGVCRAGPRSDGAGAELLWRTSAD